MFQRHCLYMQDTSQAFDCRGLASGNADAYRRYTLEDALERPRKDGFIRRQLLRVGILDYFPKNKQNYSVYRSTTPAERSQR